ncbi:MAG: ABC transporter substrate-binding protein, partial [Acetobacteraceae bacterium]
TSDRVVRFRLKQPFPHLLDALAHPIASVCAIMPERLADTDPNVQVTEMVGSGPYRFLKDEYVSGSRVAYQKFAGYVPRQEPADWAAGGKRAYFERVEWHVIPDSATVAAALRSGEVDWWDIALPDLVPLLENSGQVTVAYTDPLGFDSILRFNCLNPPFDKAALRRAVLGAIDQREFMQAILSNPKSWRTCYAMFACGLPHVREVGTDLMQSPRNLAQARAAVTAAGYQGEKVVILNPTDFWSIAPQGEVLADLLKKLGMNVDLQAMDLGTMAQRRASKAPVDKGGWSIFITNAPSVALGTPTLNYYIRGQGANGWYGWFDDAKMEQLCNTWLQTTSSAEQDRLFGAIQRVAFRQAPMVPLGQFKEQTAYRTDLTGVIPAALSFPWNVRRS